MPEFKVFKGNREKVFKMFRRDSVALVFVILLAIVVSMVIAAVLAFYHNQQNSNRIQPGVFIKGINVSGLTKEEATRLIEEDLKGQMNENIELIYKNHNYYVEVEQIEAKFDIASSVDYAFGIAKSGDFVKDVKDYITVLVHNINIEPVFVYNDDALTKYLKTIESNLPDQIVEASYYLEDDELVITKGTNGAGIEFEPLKEEIVAALKDISYSRKYIEIPTYVTYPKPIDVDQIHSEVFREPQNAYFTTEPYAVFPDVKGVDFNVDGMKTLIQDNPDSEEYICKLDYKKADVTVQDIGREAFPNVISSFSTRYVTSNTDRTTNLRLASNKIDGYVVMPGETFSYNKVVGKRTIAAGYKEAAIYSNGEVTQGLGGGICQISTTLYNAVVEADLDVTERRNHMFVPSYVDGGMDATVVYGSQDFKFKNTRDYPIKIESSVSGGIARVRIHGLRTNNEYNISIESKTVKNSSKSFVVDAYKVYRQDGEVIRREKLSRDTYKKQ